MDQRSKSLRIISNEHSHKAQIEETTSDYDREKVQERLAKLAGGVAVIVGKILENKSYAYGFDSQTGDYADLVKKGIIDPTKVVRTAIQNAASVAALLITTEAMVAELPKKAGAGPAMPPGGGMGGMDF